MRPRSMLSLMICVLTLGTVSLAQTAQSRLTGSAPQSQGQTTQGVGSVDTVASELGLLRKSLQTLNDRLRVISESLLGTDAKQSDTPKERQTRMSASLNLLSQAEQRAEVFRKQLIETMEKETALKGRLVQLDEDLRPESIERAVVVGSTRAYELRDARRRILENDHKGVEALLSQASQNRLRLEDDVRQAEAMVSRLRQKVLPQIEKEIDKIDPN